MSVQTILFIGIAAILALGLSLLQYYKKQKNKRVKHWALFSVLRFITYFSVFLLLINPTLNQTTFSVEKPSLVIATDNSSSIKELADQDEVKAFVSRLKNNEKIAENFSVENYSFGSTVRANDSLQFNESQSNLDQAFKTFQNLYSQKNAPTIFISDGNQTFGQDYVYTAKQYQQPVIPVVVGDTTKYTDIKIAQVNVNRFAFLNNKFPVEIFINYEGTSSIEKEVKIQQNNQMVFSEKLSFSANKRSEQLTAILPATSVGVKTYKISVEELSSEKNTANNTKNFAIEVIDQKTNVLLLSAISHPDLGMFKKAIEHNQQREAKLKFIEDEIDFGNYQLVILYQPTAQFEAAYQQINKLGLNTLTITGNKTDYAFLNQQQDFFSKEINGQEENYLAEYSSNYSAFQFVNIGFEDFPPLTDQFGSLEFTTEQQTLLFQSVDGFKTESPLMASLQKDTKRHGFIFGENMWQWRAKSFRDQGDFNAFDEFFGKYIQYLASNKRRERLSLSFDSFYNSGEPIRFQAQYVDATYQFDPRAKISIQVENKDTSEKQLFPFLLKDKVYEVDLSNLKAGEYSFTVNVAEENFKKTGSFTIVDFDVEQQFLNANTEKLKKIASDKVYFLDQEEALINQLLSAKAYKPVQKSTTQKSPLIDWYYLLIIIVASLSIEWFLRKYNGLI